MAHKIKTKVRGGTMKNLKSKFRKTALAIMIASAGLLGASSTANANEGDPWFRAWKGSEWVPFLEMYYQFVEEVDNQFFAINTYLSEIYAYLTKGEGETGKGVIGTMLKIWSEERPFLENMTNQQANWQRTTAAEMMPAQTAMARAPDPRSCSELPTTIGARYATGGGGSSRRARVPTETNIAKSQGGTKPNDVAYANEMYSTHKSSGYCTKEDAQFPNSTVDRNAAGCTMGDTAKMPDADARIQSVFRPAHDYTDANAVKQHGTSLTYNLGRSTPSPVGDQAKAADDAIATMITRFSPPALPKEVEQTPAGRVLFTKIKTFNARISPALEFLASAKARNDASQSDIPAEYSNGILADFKDFYGRMFAGSPVPEKPSEAEVMRYEVLRRYADTNGEWMKTLMAQGDAGKIAQIQAQTQGVELYLLYNLHERQVETNAILSALLAQSVNPITRAELQSTSNQISK